VALYSKKDYEADLEQLETASHAISGMLVRGEINGFQVLKLDAGIEIEKRKLKGRLLVTRSILQDGDSKSKCKDKKNHRQPCKCMNLFKHQEAEKVAEKDTDRATG